MKTTEAKKLIKENYKWIKDTLSKQANKSDKEYNEYVDRCNSKCPLCSSKDIISHMSHVKGSGYVSGNLFDISGKSNIDTKSVNKCAVCSHEWKKKERRYTLSNNNVKDELYTLAYTIQAINDKNKYKYTEALDCEYSSKEEADKAYQDNLVLWQRKYKESPISKCYPEVVFALLNDIYGSFYYKTEIRTASRKIWNIINNPTLDYSRNILTIRGKILNIFTKAFWKNHGFDLFFFFLISVPVIYALVSIILWNLR
jgi:hypothetical protein